MEWKKILFNRKLLALLLVFWLLSIIIFAVECDRKERLWQEQNHETYTEHLAKEQRQYRETFRERIQGIADQADSMEEISIFAREDSFSKRNAQLTKEAFEPLMQVELEELAGRTIEEFFFFRFGNICMLLCALLIAIALGETAKNGIRSITFATAHGRMRMALEKNGALLLWALILSSVYSLSIFVEGSLLFKESPMRLLFCPVQTFVGFENFPWRMVTWQAFVLYVLYRMIVLYVIMVLAWAICLLCDHIVLAVGFCSEFIGIEYFLYTYIADNHVLKLFKFCNVWYQAVENSYFTQYKNLNIMEYAVDRNVVILIALLIADFAGSAIGIYISCTRYPCGSKGNGMHRAIDRVKVKIEKMQGDFLEKLSLTGAETYKVLITQKGLVAILLLLLLIIYRADFTQVQRSTQQELYYEFINTYLGVPGQASQQEIKKWRDKLEQVDKIYEQKISEGPLSSEEAVSLSIWYGSYEEQRNFFSQIESQTKSLESVAEDRKIEVWYVNQHSYDHLMREGDTMLNVGLLFVILWICIGMYMGEKRRGMLAVIRSCSCEHMLYKAKYRVAIAVTSVVYLLVLLFEVITVAVVYEIRGLGAPVQSILKLSGIPFHITIWQYFLIRYIVRYVLTILFCFLVCKALENIVCSGKRGWKNGIKNRKSL